MSERNTLNALIETITSSEHEGISGVAEDILKAIRAGEIPNVKYDIYS